MKVLHVTAGLAARTGGPAASAVEMCRALAAHGVEAALWTTDLDGTAAGSGSKPVTRDGLPPGSGEVDLRLFPARPPRRLAYSPELARALAAHAGDFDVLHVHSLFLHTQWAAYRAAQRTHTPYVITLHGTLDPYLRRRGRVQKAVAARLWQDAMLDGAAVLHFGAADEARLAADVSPQVPRAVISNPVDVDAFSPLPSPAEFRNRRLGGHDGPVVLFLGRLAQKKGLDLLVRAFAHVAKDASDALLAIAGPDDDGLGAQLATIAHDSGIAERVRFVPMLDGAERLEALAAADVWVLSSYSEGSAVAALEALAAGRAVVLSPAVNVAREAADAGAAVIAPLDERSLAATLTSLLRDPARRAELGARAREYARTFSLDVVGTQLVEMYEVARAR